MPAIGVFLFTSTCVCFIGYQAQETAMNCAIVGCGRIGSTLEDDPLREKPASHAAAVRAARHTIIAGCDIDADRRAAFAKRWKVKSVYAELIPMLENHPVDILIIATPPQTHETLLEAASHFPLKAIILEKPLADTIESAESAAALARNVSVPVIINHERRFAHQYMHIKHIIESSRYGALLSVSLRLYMGGRRKFRDILYDDGTHMIDLAHYLCGDFRFSNVFNDDDTIFAGGCAGGTVLCLECGRLRDHLVFEIDCSFEKGRIVAGNGYYREYESRKSPYYRNFRSLIQGPVKFRKSGYFSQMFAHACRVAEGAENSRSNCDDALFALERVEEIIGLSAGSSVLSAKNAAEQPVLPL